MLCRVEMTGALNEVKGVISNKLSRFAFSSILWRIFFGFSFLCHVRSPFSFPPLLAALGVYSVWASVL